MQWNSLENKHISCCQIKKKSFETEIENDMLLVLKRPKTSMLIYMIYQKILR